MTPFLRRASCPKDSGGLGKKLEEWVPPPNLFGGEFQVSPSPPSQGLEAAPVSHRTLPQSSICSGAARCFLFSSVLFLFTFATAEAHHIRGIPHYSYSENYPQAPAFEEVRTVDNYELRFTFFDVPGTKAMDLALYVKTLDDGKVYDGNVKFAVYKEGEDPAAAHGADAYRNKNNIYKVGWVYEEDGIYFARVDIGTSENVVSELFRIQIGSPSVNYWFIGSSVAGVLALIVVVAVLNKNKGASPGEEV